MAGQDPVPGAESLAHRDHLGVVAGPPLLDLVVDLRLDAEPLTDDRGGLVRPREAAGEDDVGRDLLADETVAQTLGLL